MKTNITFILACLISIIGASAVFANQVPKDFNFQQKDSLKEWEEKIFKGRVSYTVKTGVKGSFLSAYSEDAASGIFYKIRFNPKEDPMVTWKWKVLKFPKPPQENTAGEWIEKDDYAARFYVIFPKLAFNLTKVLEYVWDERLPEGTIKESPYFKNIKIIVIESGKKNLGKWMLVERNVYEDYKKAFGREPGEVGAIAIMTDTDNTASTAEANYDEIIVGYKNDKKAVK